MPIESPLRGARVPCACGGENSSCFRCDGTGLYVPKLVSNARSPASAAVTLASIRALAEEKRLAEIRSHLTPRLIPKTKAQNKKVKSAVAVTPRALPTGAGARSSLLQALERKRANNRLEPERRSACGTHGTAKAAPVAMAPPQSQAPMSGLANVDERIERRALFTFVPCPDCNQPLLPNELAEHQTRLHPIRMDVVAPGAPSMATCAECGGKVKADRLKAHIERAHGKSGGRAIERNPLQAKRGSSGSKSKTEVAPRLLGSESGQSVQDCVRTESSSRAERDLDATNGFPLAYRENGRFGSPPSYDGYDEESEV